VSIVQRASSCAQRAPSISCNKHSLLDFNCSHSALVMQTSHTEPRRWHSPQRPDRMCTLHTVLLQRQEEQAQGILSLNRLMKIPRSFRRSVEDILEELRTGGMISHDRKKQDRRPRGRLTLSTRTYYHRRGKVLRPGLPAGRFAVTGTPGRVRRQVCRITWVRMGHVT
jgi:hypothetical protein